jgi:hypothetical protein
VFNRYILGKKDRTELLGITMDERDRDPRPLLRKLREETEGLPGFRFFHDHDLRILDDVLPDPACAKVILTRNPLESYVSWKIAQATDQWKLTNARRLKTAKVRFDVPEFLQHLRDIQAFQLLLMHSLADHGPDRLLPRLRRPRLGRGDERSRGLSGGRGAAEGSWTTR